MCVARKQRNDINAFYFKKYIPKYIFIFWHSRNNTEMLYLLSKIKCLFFFLSSLFKICNWDSPSHRKSLSLPHTFISGPQLKAIAQSKKCLNLNFRNSVTRYCFRECEPKHLGVQNNHQVSHFPSLGLPYHQKKISWHMEEQHEASVSRHLQLLSAVGLIGLENPASPKRKSLT